VKTFAECSRQMWTGALVLAGCLTLMSIPAAQAQDMSSQWRYKTRQIKGGTEPPAGWKD